MQRRRLRHHLLPGDFVLDFPAGDWDLARIDLPAGLTVYDIDTGGNDLLLQNRNVVIDGPPGATAIFRVPDSANFLISQAALLLGTGGIAPGSVLFYTDKPDDDAHFGFSSSTTCRAAPRSSATSSRSAT